MQKKVASRLEPESTPEVEKSNSAVVDEADERFISARKKSRGEKPKEVRSLTGEIIDEKRMAELRKIK